MCLLALSNTKTILPESYFSEASSSNPDGFGLAVATSSGLLYEKTLKPDHDTYVKYTQICQSHPNRPIMLHWRLATHGLVNLANCHPLTVHGGLCMGHNGIVHIPTKPDESDSAALARSLSSSNPIHDKGLQNLLTAFCKSNGNSKLVFLDELGEYCIINESAGHWKEDTWFSNESYLPWHSPFRKPSKFQSQDWEFNDHEDYDYGNQCDLCGEAITQNEPVGWNHEYYGYTLCKACR